MRRCNVEIEHKYNNKVVAKHVFDDTKPLSVIGSSRNADIRLLGEGIDGVHAYIEKDEKGWRLIDAGSNQGIWLQKNPVESVDINEPCTVRIGSHELSFRPIEFERNLFDSAQKEIPEGAKYLHQIVIHRNGHLVSTHTVGEGENFEFPYTLETKILTPPRKKEYVETEVGAYTVGQRLVPAEIIQHEYKSPMDYLSSPEAKIASFGLAGIVFVILLMMLAMPNLNEAELEAPELKKNQFTKMIYDADLIKKKRTEARKRQKQFAKAPSGPKNGKAVGAPPSKGGTPKVVSKLKMKGLQAMLGKISARASKNAIKIQGQGSAPRAGVGRAQASGPATGSLDGVKTAAGTGGPSYKVASVGTIGAGGGRGLAGIGGLAAGGVGSASVGILDEETEIEGGLDKDVIARVIESHLGEIRYCYERQLAAQPDIYGKVTVRFTINAGGAVATQRVGSTSLRSAVVEGCILRRVASWQFPEPKGGTTVLVTYPFLFKSTQ